MRCVLGRLSFRQEVEVTRNCCQGISGIQSWFLSWSLAPPGQVPKASHFSAIQFDRRWWRKESISARVCRGEHSTSCWLPPLAGKSSGTGEEMEGVVSQAGVEVALLSSGQAAAPWQLHHLSGTVSSSGRESGDTCPRGMQERVQVKS